MKVDSFTFLSNIIKEPIIIEKGAKPNIGFQQIAKHNVTRMTVLGETFTSDHLGSC